MELRRQWFDSLKLGLALYIGFALMPGRPLNSVRAVPPALAPSVSARIKEPARTLEVSCFLRYCLLTATDQLNFMFQRRVADLWRHCADGVAASVDWTKQYQGLLQQLSELASYDTVPDAELRSRLREIVVAKRAQHRPTLLPHGGTGGRRHPDSAGCGTPWVAARRPSSAPPAGTDKARADPPAADVPWQPGTPSRSRR